MSMYEEVSVTLSSRTPQKVSYVSLQRALSPSDYDFYYSPPYYSYSPPSDLYTDTSSSSGLGSGAVTGIAVGVVAVVIIVVTVFCICCLKRREKRLNNNIGRVGLDVEKQSVHPNQGPQYQDGNSSGPPPPMRAQNYPPSNGAEFAMPQQNYSVPISNYTAGSSNYSSGSDRPPPPQSPRVGFMMSQSEFTFEELSIATDSFSRGNLLGQGGFGYVYRGVLPSGKVVAVKQLKAGSGQGEREFQAEVEVISRVHHRHLVSLVGYCISGDQRMLVYEFIQNGTLEFHLHGKGKPAMKWALRMKMAIGSAKGLAYLHEDCHPRIIHRDIKAANILVDKDFESKVADFGLAKFSLDTETHISTRIMGTFGYLAPEYASTGKLTDKSDVFSFGIVLLELISGRYPIDKNNPSDESMVEWARPKLMQAMEKGNFVGLVDPKLQNEYNPTEMNRMIACAAACVRHSARIRPRMSQVARALDGSLPLEELSEGVRPGHSTVYGSQGSGDYNTQQYKKDMEKFKKLALESQNHTTGEYSVASTGSGLNTSVWSGSDSQITSEEIEMSYNKHSQLPR